MTGWYHSLSPPCFRSAENKRATLSGPTLYESRRQNSPPFMLTVFRPDPYRLHTHHSSYGLPDVSQGRRLVHNDDLTACLGAPLPGLSPENLFPHTTSSVATARGAETLTLQPTCYTATRNGRHACLPYHSCQTSSARVRPGCHCRMHDTSRHPSMGTRATCKGAAREWGSFSRATTSSRHMSMASDVGCRMPHAASASTSMGIAKQKSLRIILPIRESRKVICCSCLCDPFPSRSSPPCATTTCLHVLATPHSCVSLL